MANLHEHHLRRCFCINSKHFMSLLNYKQKTERVFNKFFSSFLKDLKEVNDELRKKVKSNYKVVDKSSSEYCTLFSENMLCHLTDFTSESFSEAALSKFVCKEVTLSDVVQGLDTKSEEEKNIIKNYLYVLMLFAHMASLEEEDELFKQVVTILTRIQEGDQEGFETEKDDVIDDDIKSLLEIIRRFGLAPKAPKLEKEDDGPADPSSLFGMLGNSKIANLAKEISQDIDVSSLKTDNPEDLIKSMLDFNSGNNVLGNIIQKVSSSLNNKISNGELKQEDLLGEAMSMMNLFGGSGNNPLASNPLFAQMMKGMKSGKASVRPDVVRKSDARTRLRKKLEARNKNVE